MKLFATLFIAMGTLGLAAQSATQSFAQAAAEAEQRLEQSLDELDSIQQEINEQRPKLGARLDDVESRALRLRDEASNVARVKAGFDVEVSQLENEKESVIDNNSYIQSTLLNEYIRRFELTIDPSEKPMYTEDIREALSFLEVDEDVDDATIFSSQLEVVEMALKRVERVTGGDTFSGPAIVDGSLRDGMFALVGPSSYFTDNEGSAGVTNGMIENRANIYILPTYASAITTTINSGSGIIPIDTTDGEALEGITHTITLTEEWALGGFVMYPILGLFSLSILIALFKTFELFRVKAARAKDIDVILDHISNEKNDAALAHAKSVGGPVGEMLCAAVENASEDREVIEEVLYEKIIKTQPKLERMLAFIAVVAATAPLLGLLGTVTGMIKTFKLITIVGTGDARNLSSGISEALITTKWGLIVAIPTLIMHALLNRKAKGVVGSMEQSAVGFINGIIEIRARENKQG
ncbi:MAG TPA: MotA/TolQ/ExbB proton channel family protein [Oceanipulchritudo sp.]|nr:MotA/TolQ/ExbB proton channel family protein [Oceanipulchritudo sp.]